MAGPRAQLIGVGKRRGRATCSQRDINDLMARLARGGRNVVRLKSGDPSLFGRLGEEIESLRMHGVAFEVVPGVTAATAMAAALGVSLTHRDCARSVRFVTGHSRHGGIPEDVDWKVVADPSATTIFYMGGRNAAAIAERLTSLCLAPDTPAIVAASVARPEQRIVRTTLDSLAAVIEAMPTPEPVIIGVGAVFGDCADAAYEDRVAVVQAT